MQRDAPAVEIITIEPRLAAIVRATVAFPDMPRAQRDARAALADAASAGAFQPVGSPFTLWRTPKDGLIDYAPGVFVTDSFDAADRVSLTTVPGGRAAYLRWRGSYNTLSEGWRQVFTACGRRGLSLTGIQWEIYAEAGASPETIETEFYALLS